jgi:hypothetical protein
MFPSVDGGRSRIYNTTSQRARRRRFLVLMMDAPGSSTPPPKGPIANVLQLSGNRSQTFDNVAQGGTMNMTFFGSLRC